MPFADLTDGSVFYVKTTTTKLYAKSKPGTGKPRDPLRTELLWGDRVRLLKDDAGAFIQADGRFKAKARARTGWVDKADLGTKKLLEIYFIDVGQGDGVLISTPNGRHVLIDGGWPRASQPTGKNAADFVDWKFIKDYESAEHAIELDAIICSHNDQDHYGGLWDLLDPTQWSEGPAKELNATEVFVERFYHAGLSWWKEGSDRTLGTPVETTKGSMYMQLLEDRASLEAGLASGASPALQGEWAKFLRKVKDARTRAGTPTPVQRLSHVLGHLDSFAGGSSGSGTPEPVIHVLAPVEFLIDGAPAIRHYTGGESKNTNGNSVLLRLDCGDVRVLLTGDLNTKSQATLLKDYEDEEDAFECDVAKACHHGSDDVSYAFLGKMAPMVTVISSGDSEGHDHPRPEIIAASAATGHATIKGDSMVTPLIYSTELARSLEVGKITHVHSVQGPGDETELDLAKLKATAKITMAGDRNPREVRRDMKGRYLMTGMVYGLINVRTDGKKILCAALNEKESTWNVRELKPKKRD